MKHKYFQNRKKYFSTFLPTLLLLLFSWSTTFATECDELKVTTTNTAIQITNIEAPKASIKIFDSNWNRQAECNDNCTGEIEFSALNAGEYHVQVQLFDENWEELCDTTIDVFLDGCFCPQVFIPVCGVDGNTYGNSCIAACAGVEIVAEGECPIVTTCDLLASITLSTNLCEQGLTEIAVYELDDKSFLVFLADNVLLSDGQTRVIDCDTGEEFCVIGGIMGATCDGFLDKAEKLETVLQEDCGGCICQEIFAPVCGADGRTYGNECEAACAGVEVMAEGACEPCVCDAEFAPVCGVDGNTYSNRCMADCAGVDIISEGECPCLCPAVALPVCGVDGITYVNACQAACAGIEVAFDGPCEECLGTPLEEVACPQVFDPVCGCDGVTYGNSCDASVAGVKSWTEGPCVADCACPEIYAPVCGVDGRTYSNECEALCLGVTVLSEGECNNEGECDILAVIDFSGDLCATCITEIAIYSYEGQNYLVSLGDFVNCPDAVNSVVSCAFGINIFCEEGGDNTGTPCGDFFEKAVKVSTILKEDCEDDCQGLPTPGAPCPEIYAPVCACDGNTYDNECVAQNLGLKSWTEGACSFTNIECGVINIAYNNQTVIMKGAPEASYFFKIHDTNNEYLEVFDCTQNCGSEQIANLPPGTYAVKIYDTEWALVCEQAITLLDESLPSNGIFRCDDATITYRNGTVQLIGDESKSYHLKVIDTHYKDAFACMWECGSTITAENIPVGSYLVRVFDEEYTILCEESILMTTSSLTIRDNNDVQLAAYPNPAQTEYFLRIQQSETKGKGTLQVINAFGQVMTTQTLDNQYDETIRLDLSKYQNGLYFYQVKLPNQQLTIGKFLVNRLY